MEQRNQPRPQHKLLIGCLAAAAFAVVLTGVLGVALIWFLWTAASRITIDPVAVNDIVKQSIVMTLKDGTPQQKLDMLHALRDAGPAAKDYVPELTAALDDDDPAVRTAAAEAIKKIDPDAAVKAGIN
jgi:hypothetical protein